MMYRAEIIFVSILFPFSAGIWIFYNVNFTKLNFALLSFNITLFILLLIFNCLYLSLKVYHHKVFIGFLLNIFFFTMGSLVVVQYKNLKDPHYFGYFPGAYLQIKVAEEPQQHGHMMKFSAEVSQVYQQHRKFKTTGNLLVTIQTDSLCPKEVKYGEVYLIPANYTDTEPPANPAEFDFKSWLAAKNIYQQIFLPQRQLIAAGGNEGNPLIRFSLALRQQQLTYYRSLLKNNEAFAVAATLILGYRSDLSAETLSAYSKTGTIHALSVSGMHVGIIYLVLEWVLQLLNRKKIWKLIKVILILALIWFYTVLTGCSASVLRSAIMLTVFILAKALRRNTNSYNILAFSAFCLLLYNPFLLMDPGFELSFLSVFGLIYLQPRIHRLFFFKSKWVEKLWSMISLSLAAQVLTFPFSIYYFHQFPVYFILSNLFITLPIAVLMYMGIAILLFHMQWLAPLFESLILFTNRGLDYIAHLPCSGIGAIWINQIELSLLCLFILTFITGLALSCKPLFFSSLLFLLSLQTCIGYDKIISLRQQKIVLFTLQKNYAAAFISSHTAVLVTGLRVTDKTFKFFIQPALDQLKITAIICVPSTKDTVVKGLVLKAHQLSYRNFHILFVDTFFNKLRIANRPAFDVVWLQYTPRIRINELQQEVRFKTLWIDATNKTYAIKNDQIEAVRLKLIPVLLKKNNKASAGLGKIINLDDQHFYQDN